MNRVDVQLMKADLLAFYCSLFFSKVKKDDNSITLLLSGEREEMEYPPL